MSAREEVATYWDQAKITEARDDFAQDAMGHAGELETSMMMVIRPDLVGEHRRDEVPKGNAFATSTRGWTTKDRSEPGHIGVPATASAEKGEALFSIFTDGAMKLIREIRDWDGHRWVG